MGVAALHTTDDLNLQNKDLVLSLSKDLTNASPEQEAAFQQVMEQLFKEFPADQYKEQVEQISFLASQPAFKAAAAAAPHCDFGEASATTAMVKGVTPFPGGVISRLFGFDLSKLVDKVAGSVTSPAGANAAFPSILATQALATGAGMIQSAMHVVLQVVPPMIPPPVWINQPLPCLPMVTGKNCFGSVLYPITAADFVTADITDAQLDGVIADFPRLYRSRVGQTSDAAYKTCYAAYMGMQCANIFPRCSTAMAREEPSPIGRLPLCFTSCILSLVACPGLWVTDIMDECSFVSAPPMCSMAIYMNMATLPPQYQSYEASVGAPKECPVAPASMGFDNASSDFALYSLGDLKTVPTSPYAAATTGSLPSA